MPGASNFVRITRKADLRGQTGFSTHITESGQGERQTAPITLILRFIWITVKLIVTIRCSRLCGWNGIKGAGVQYPVEE